MGTKTSAVVAFMIVVWAAPAAAQANGPNARPPERQQETRSDLVNLESALRLIARLHPSLDGAARVSVRMGSLDGRLVSPLMEIDLVHEGDGRLARDGAGALVPEKSHKVYGGVVRFDTEGRLLTYSGRASDGEERFEQLKTQVGPDATKARIDAALVARGALFVHDGPTIESCPALRIVADAIGNVTSTKLERGGMSDYDSKGEELYRRDLTWSLEMSAQRDGVSKRFFVSVDPWGDVLSIGRYGEAWP